MCLQFEFVMLWQMEIGTKSARKILKNWLQVGGPSLSENGQNSTTGGQQTSEEN